jgi:hypothetical protein
MLLCSQNRAGLIVIPNLPLKDLGQLEKEIWLGLHNLRQLCRLGGTV